MIPENILVTAISECRKSEGHIYRHGCVIWDDERIISKGHNNTVKFHRLKKYGYPFLMLHSESSAIIKKDMKALHGANLLVIRLSPADTKLCSSKPCKHCMSMIVEAKIKNLYFSNTEGKIEKISFI